MNWLGVIVLLAVLLGGCADRLDSYKRHCIEAGGHLYSPDITLCVTADGRLVEVYP